MSCVLLLCPTPSLCRGILLPLAYLALGKSSAFATVHSVVLSPEKSQWCKPGDSDFPLLPTPGHPGFSPHHQMRLPLPHAFIAVPKYLVSLVVSGS